MSEVSEMIIFKKRYMKNLIHRELLEKIKSTRLLLFTLGNFTLLFLIYYLGVGAANGFKQNDFFASIVSLLFCAWIFGLILKGIEVNVKLFRNEIEINNIPFLNFGAIVVFIYATTSLLFFFYPPSEPVVAEIISGLPLQAANFLFPEFGNILENLENQLRK